MIELLARLEPGSSGSLAAMQDSGRGKRASSGIDATSMVCPYCRGKPRQKRTCSRCNGTGRMHETGGQGGTRAAYNEAHMSPAYIASLLGTIPAVEAVPEQGIAAEPERRLDRWKVDAALVHVLNSQQAAERLAYHVAMEVVSPQSKAWRMPDEETRSKRVGGLVHAAVIDLALFPKRLAKLHSARFVGVADRTWSETWEPRQEAIFRKMRGWCDDVDSHMARAHFGPRRDRSAA